MSVFPGGGRGIAASTQANPLLAKPTQIININQDTSVLTQTDIDIDYLSQQVSYALKAPQTDPSPPSTIPNYIDRANKYLAFDAAGNPIAIDAPASSSLIVGQSGTGYQGSFVVTKTQSQTLNGQSAVGSSGSFSYFIVNYGLSTVYVSGVSGTGSVGTFGITKSQSITLAGQAGTGSTGWYAVQNATILNNQVWLQATSPTNVAIRYKDENGVIRSVNLTLS